MEPRNRLPITLLVLASLSTLCYGTNVEIAADHTNMLSALQDQIAALQKDTFQYLQDQISSLKREVHTLTRQTMMQQFYIEEQTRSNGDSGLKRVRSSQHGTHPYNSESHVSDFTIASIHNHDNNIRTVGMGELIAVLNGVEFRTRHNDYSLQMKSTTTTEYGATEPIEFPGVPPEVTSLPTVEEQSRELKSWFRAWQDQDYSVRDYRPYFKPVLCYLEGKWTISNQDDIQESFDSDRHHLDASSWHDLQNKIRFTSYSGSKDGLENFAYLPTTYYTMVNDTIPLLAQWNYDILCHPLSRDLPLQALKPVDDLKTRMSTGQTFEEYVDSKAARFKLGLTEDNRDSIRRTPHSLLDQLMEEIPGLDNYPGHIVDDVFGDAVYPFDNVAEERSNAAYFQRSYRVEKEGAMGLKVRHRGFADENLFVAQTTQPNVAGLSVESCRFANRRRICQEWNQKWSYAIPLEIIYLTPLAEWNPHNITYWGDARSPEGNIVYEGPEGRRNGRWTENKAYNGTNSKTFYRTPLDFFGNAEDVNPADTSRNAVYVLNENEEMCAVRSSGVRIKLPEIEGVGSVRQRYPIMPIHEEGSGVWKELAAVKEIVLNPDLYWDMLYEVPVIEPEILDDDDINAIADPDNEIPTSQHHRFITEPAAPEYKSHTHHVIMDPDQYHRYNDLRESIDVLTDVAIGHSHSLRIRKVYRELNGEIRPFALILSCDGERRCWDRHGRRLLPE